MQRKSHSRKVYSIVLLVMLCTTWGCNQNTSTKPTLENTNKISSTSWSMTMDDNRNTSEHEQVKSDITTKAEAKKIPSVSSGKEDGPGQNTIFTPMNLALTEPTDSEMQACIQRLNVVVAKIEAFRQALSSTKSVKI